jgi:hypothetical protein
MARRLQALADRVALAASFLPRATTVRPSGKSGSGSTTSLFSRPLLIDNPYLPFHGDDLGYWIHRD